MAEITIWKNTHGMMSVRSPAGVSRYKDLCWAKSPQGEICTGGADHLGPHMARQKFANVIFWENERVRKW